MKETVPLGGQALVIILVMLPFGFRLFPVGAPRGLLLLLVFGVGLDPFSYALAIAVRMQEWMFWAVQQALLCPLMILSECLAVGGGSEMDAFPGGVQPTRVRG